MEGDEALTSWGNSGYGNYNKNREMFGSGNIGSRGPYVIWRPLVPFVAAYIP